MRSSMIPGSASPRRAVPAGLAAAALLAWASGAGCGEPPAVDAGSPSPTARNAAAAPVLAARITASTPVDRFVEASALFLGKSYAGGPLGEGEGASPDPDPRVDFERADCVTYLEQSLALALTPAGDAPPAAGADGFLRRLDSIRYRDGQVGFPTTWSPTGFPRIAVSSTT